MLRILKANEFDKYAEYAYQLALNQASSSYPTYADGIKTREEFMELATRGCGDNPDSRILLFEHGDMVKGRARRHSGHRRQFRIVQTASRPDFLRYVLEQ